MRTIVPVLVGASLALTCAAGHAQETDKDVLKVSIERKSLRDALNEWAQQTGNQLIAEIKGEFVAPKIEGKLTAQEALERLLEGTPLTYQWMGDRLVAIKEKSLVLPAALAPTSALDEKQTSIRVARLSGDEVARVRLAADDVRIAQNDQGSRNERRARDAESVTDAMEVILVTAQKRKERLIDVPQAVSVLSSDVLAKLGAVQFRDFANTVPGLTFATAGVGFTQISLRGVTAGFDVASTVGIYVDEVPYGSSTTFANGARATLDVGLFDVDRIEVLRGPQGTLYGASTMGGLIKYVSKLPDATRFGVDLQTGVSSTQEGDISYNVAGVVNAPLVTNKVAMRASAFQSRDGGYIDNLARGEKDVNQSDVHGGRLDLSFTPSEALTLRIGSFLQDISRDGPASADYRVSGEPVDGSVEQRRLLAEPYEQRFRLISGTIGYDFGSSALTSISSYQTTEMEFGADVSLRFVPLLALPAFGSRAYSAVGLAETAETDKFTQEVRLASQGLKPIEWVIGGFYTRETSHRTQSLLPRDLAGLPAPADLLNFSSPTHYEEYAAFGDLTWRLTSKIDVTGGVRYAENRQDFTQFGSGLLITSRPTNRSSEDVFTYLANARYHFSDHAIGYLRYATGYRPGGPNFVVNDPTTGLPIAPTTYEADRLKSYEAGFKAETEDQRFGIDLAAYDIDWDNIQILVNRGGLSVIGNAASGASVRGAEFAFTARPLGAFTATGSFAYQDASMSQANADLRAAKGERLPNVPRVIAALSADYGLPLQSEWRPTVGATVRYVSDRMVSYDASVAPPQYRLPEYTTIDLRVGFTFGSTNAQLYVRNLFDERGQLYMPTTIVNANSPRPVTILQPRTIGVAVNTHF